MTDKAKQRVRDVQDQTGWPYRHTKFLIQWLSYAVVTEAVDRAIAEKTNLDTLRASLGAQARAAQAAFVPASPGPRGA
jgi:hypothetical protein